MIKQWYAAWLACMNYGMLFTHIIIFILVNMANTVDEYAFDEDDTIQSMRRKRLSTNINIPPSEYLHRNRQAVVFSNTLMNDEGEDITSL